ncbi:hypothetical protein EXIGLDRAFT_605949 [Exidia glandulosa HHB12029]|uniref:Phosphatidic acid phosphatase type 2/haloperoxidase domain-containing protein n=1 Tax=Exidia glandulosa HHB12029 TaxID=1314781 RepID=A0A165MGF1_EXIGL|nr:hypothetical protein EXIGLDRAFT_605949 [Exidia glandulosa HHB12029]
MEPQPAAVSAQARANFYGLTREPELSATVVDDISPDLVDPIPDERPGTQPEEVYVAAMAWWRLAMRTAVMKNLETESRILGAMQERIRSPWLDNYFVYTSSLGTHTFFMIFLPAFFFFGRDEEGRGLLYMLTIGVYVSSFIKDLVCAPRPFAPPVTRLTIGNHHLEYGFPSTHSTNSVSIALYFHSLAYDLYQTGAWPEWAYYVSVVVLVWYTFSIVFGRLYTGMHSFTDCAVGTLLGSSLWFVHWTYGSTVDRWITNGGWHVPALVIPVALFAIRVHPQPVDDCPCFDDAIACIAVVMGAFLARWHSVNAGFDYASDFYGTRTPGWQKRDWQDWSIWVTLSAFKLVSGVVAIALWRMLVKFIMHTILPPIYRSLARIATLPNRRFYIPATDYSTLPTEKTLQPIPSVIDLPSTLHAHTTVSLPRNHVYRKVGGNEGPKLRGSKRNGRAATPTSKEEDMLTVVLDSDVEPVKHYDADVLTKIIVYTGISILATELVPLTFELLGLGLN